jgi:hypothetical protein
VRAGIDFPQIDARKVVTAMTAYIHPLADGFAYVEVEVFIRVVTFACSAEMTANAPILSAHGAVQISLAPASCQEL